MTIRDRLFNAWRSLRGAVIPDEWWEGWTIGSSTKSGERVNEAKALTISAVHRAVTILSTTIGVMPCRVMKRRTDRTSDEVQHDLNDVLGLESNPECLAISFKESRQAQILLFGNGFAEIMRSGSGRVQLAPISSARVVPSRNGSGRLQYEVSKPDGSKGVPVPRDRMLHIPGLGGDGVWGWSTIHYARESLGLALAAQDYGSGLFGKGAKPSGILKSASKLPKDKRIELREEWERAHKGPDAPHRVAVLDGGLEWQAVSIPPEDAQFLETRQFQVVEIARWFGVPPHLLYDLSRATFSNIEHQSIEFVVYSLMAYIERWQQELTRKLLTEGERRDGLYVAFNPRALLEGDTATQTEHVAKMVGSGIYQVNEGRRWFDLPSVENGDVNLVPVNLQRLDSVGSPRQMPVRGDDLPDGPDLRTSQTLDAPSIGTAAREIVRDVVSRMIRLEANEIVNAGKRSSGYDARVDAFYDRQGERLASALRPSVRLLRSLGRPVEVDRVVAEWIAEGRREAIDASECSASEFGGRIEGLGRRWETVRVDRWVENLTGGK